MALVLVLLLVPSMPAGAAAPVPVPTPVLTVPPAGMHGHALFDSWFQLQPFGYEQQELFVSGTAVDGAGASAPYTTRMIVTRPTDPAKFNGVVLLDWVNVTAQFENPVDTLLARPMLMREGYAFVHVSVQQAGLCCLPLLTPKMWDPVRYAAINHPGDAYADDILTQVAQSFRRPHPPGGVDPMGAIGVGRVQHVLAAGQSQSGIKLHEYVAGWLPSHPSSVGVIDGILVHGDIGEPKAYPHKVLVKVINLLSDSEAVDDHVDPANLDPNLRLWEIAGGAHADHWVGYQQVFGTGPRQMVEAAPVPPSQYQAILDAAGNYGEQIAPTLAVCEAGGAAMPMHAAASAAIHQLTTWVSGGPAPRSGPRYQFSGGSLAKDQYGNTMGGIRLPPIDVPVATYLSSICGIGGITVPFTDVQLQLLYGSHAHYLELMRSRTDKAVADGWLLPEDAVDLMAHACRARNRFPAYDGACPTYVPPAYDTTRFASASAAAPKSSVTTAAHPSSSPSAASPSPGRGPTGGLPKTGADVPALAALLALGAALVLRRLVPWRP